MGGNKLYIILKCIEVYEESRTSVKQCLLIAINFRQCCRSLLLIDPILKSGASKRESFTLAWRPSVIKSHHGGNVYNTLSCTSTQLHCWVICTLRIAFMVHRWCYICFMAYPINIVGMIVQITNWIIFYRQK